MRTTPVSIEDIRDELSNALYNKDFVTDKSGVKTIELVGVSFIADEPLIFGELNEDYIKRELEWYKSQSLFVKDIPGKTPVIWEQVASTEGKINSNYGWAICHEDNDYQFVSCGNALISNPDSRRAIMIYTRPSMQTDYCKNGMSDFMCTNTVQYLIRDNKINAIVSMRSNDVVFGYRNDFAWQKHVLEELVKYVNELGNMQYEIGDIIWSVGSLHVYERHFYLVDNYINSGKTHIAKKDYKGEWQ